MREPIFGGYQSVWPITIDQTGLQLQMLLLYVLKVKKSGHKIHKNVPKQISMYHNIAEIDITDWNSWSFLNLACHEDY